MALPDTPPRPLLSRDDFLPKRANFDLGESQNAVRMLVGAMLLPHALGKLSGGGLNPGTIGFFDSVGFHPAPLLVGFAAAAEIVGGLCLILGLATRWTALGVAAIMALTIVALVRAGGLHWFWGAGGIEYSLFWGLAALAVSVTAFKHRHGDRTAARHPANILSEKPR